MKYVLFLLVLLFFICACTNEGINIVLPQVQAATVADKTKVVTAKDVKVQTTTTNTVTKTEVSRDKLNSDIVASARSMLYIREKTNNNDHPMIDKMLAYLGLPKGLSWCLAFVQYSWKLGCDLNNLKQPLYKSAKVSTFLEEAKANPMYYEVIERDEIEFGQKLQPADIMCYSHSANGKKEWNGHAALVASQDKNFKFHTIEGNTMPGTTGNQREGGGAYERVRTWGNAAFLFEGAVRYCGKLTPVKK